MSPRTRRVWLGGCLGGGLLIGSAVLLLGVRGVSRGLLFTGDTNHLVAGSRVMLDCLHGHVLRSCAFDPVRGQSQVGPYPLLQYLPATAMRGLGFHPNDVLEGLGWVNFAAFVISLGLIASVASRAHRRLWRPLLVVLAASGPLWFYATAGFGEMFAAMVVLGAVLACLHRRPLLVVVLVLLACLGKETLPPFVLALGLLAGRRDGDGWLPPRRVLVPLVVGVAGGTALSFGFNVFRYGTVRNVRYLQPQFRASGAGRVSRNIADLMFAPGGGLAVFWPVVAMLLIAAAVFGVGAMSAREWQPAVRVTALFAVFGAFTVGLAVWWAPFGWIAWGPRLYVPLIPALAVVTIHVGGARLARVVAGSLVAPSLFAGMVAVTLIGAYPEVSSPWIEGPAVASLRVLDAGCPSAGTPGSDVYWHCFDHRAWRLSATPLRTATTHDDAFAWASRVAVLGGLALLLLAARTAAAELRPLDDGDYLATTR